MTKNEHLDNFDVVFDILDKIFKGSPDGYNKSRYIDFSSSEKQMDDDSIYYTFKINGLEKDDIIITVTEFTLDILIKKDPDAGFFTNLPCPVLPKKTKSTMKNGVLDIVIKIDKNQMKEKVNIE
jgi:HSP20 family molecular chaperone IbpA